MAMPSGDTIADIIAVAAGIVAASFLASRYVVVFVWKRDHVPHAFHDSDSRTAALANAVLAGMLPAATTNDVGEGRTEAQRPARTRTEIAPHSEGGL